MQYRTVKKNGDRLSVLGYGCMRLPQSGGRIDRPEARRQLLSAIDRGVNYLDTAYPYHNGESEPFLGEALEPSVRNTIKLATKLPPSAVRQKSDMEKILDSQLRKLKTDRIDYYLLHGLDELSWEKFRRFDVIEFLEEQVQKGKILNPGFSFHGPAELFRSIVDVHDWVFCQIQYNILDEYFQAGRAGLEYAASKDIAVMIMEPLRGGTLTANIPKEIMKIWNASEYKRSPAEWALKWLWDQEDVTLVLSGMNRDDHITENIRTAEESNPGCLSAAEHEVIRAVRDKYKELLEIPCTACGYCMPCPKGINIPGSFDLYNRVAFYKDGKFQNQFRYMLHNGGLEKDEKNYVSKCVNCGKCVKACPQGIAIPRELKKVEKMYEGLFLRIFEIVGRIFYRRAKQN